MQMSIPSNQVKEKNLSHVVVNNMRTGGTAQFKDHRSEVYAQRKLGNLMESCASKQEVIIQKKENNTGLPDTLKSGIENLSGYSMDDVKVHYNSERPAQLNAHAYAQGSDIHIASGQEKHLPHEAWHVVQQKQGRVKPTMQMKQTVNVNDDEKLEKEADVMGAKAAQMSASDSEQSSRAPMPFVLDSFLSIQGMFVDGMDLTYQEVWDEVEWIAEDRGISSEDRIWMKNKLFEMDETKSADNYEDIEEELELELCRKLDKRFPYSSQNKVSVSEKSSGIFSGAMRMLTGYLAFYVAIASVLPKASALDIENIEVIDCDDFPEICGIDLEDVIVYPPGKITCGDEMSHFCDEVLATPLYAETLDAARNACAHGISMSVESSAGACRFTPDKFFFGGSITCDQAKTGIKHAPKIAHELEHAIDFCNERQVATVGVEWVHSEINAHERQAAVTHERMANGLNVDLRDKTLMEDFKKGCPNGGVMRESLKSYYKLYEKPKDGKFLTNHQVEERWGAEVRAAVLRFKREINTGKRVEVD